MCRVVAPRLCRCPQGDRPNCPFGAPVPRFRRAWPSTQPLGEAIRRSLAPVPLFPLLPWPGVAPIGLVWRRLRVPLRGPRPGPERGPRPRPLGPCRLAPWRPQPAPGRRPLRAPKGGQPYGPRFPPILHLWRGGRRFNRPWGGPLRLKEALPRPPAPQPGPTFRIGQVGLAPSLANPRAYRPWPLWAARGGWAAATLVAAWHLGSWVVSPGPAFTPRLISLLGLTDGPRPMPTPPLLGPTGLPEYLSRRVAWVTNDLDRAWARGLGRAGPANGHRRKLPGGGTRLVSSRHKTWAITAPWAVNLRRDVAALVDPGWAGTIKFWGWEPWGGGQLGPDYAIFRARAVGAHLADLLARGGAAPAAAISPLLPAEGLTGRRYRGAKMAPGRPWARKRWFYSDPETSPFFATNRKGDVWNPARTLLGGVPPGWLGGLPPITRQQVIEDRYVPEAEGQALFKPQWQLRLPRWLDPWGPDQRGAPALTGLAPSLRHVGSGLSRTPPGVFGWRLASGNLGVWADYLGGHLPPSIRRGAGRLAGLRGCWNSGPGAPRSAPLWRAHRLGAPQWTDYPPHGRGPSEVAPPRPRAQAQRLLALANLSLAPETPIVFSLRRIGRAALGGAAGAAFGLPLPHAHPSGPSPLACEALPGAVLRLGRAARASLRPPLLRGRPWGEADVPPSTPRPLLTTPPRRRHGGGRPLEPLHSEGGGHLTWLGGGAESPSYAQAEGAPSRDYSRAAISADTAALEVGAAPTPTWGPRPRGPGAPRRGPAAPANSGPLPPHAPWAPAPWLEESRWALPPRPPGDQLTRLQLPRTPGFRPSARHLWELGEIQFFKYSTEGGAHGPAGLAGFPGYTDGWLTSGGAYRWGRRLTSTPFGAGFRGKCRPFFMGTGPHPARPIWLGAGQGDTATGSARSGWAYAPDGLPMRPDTNYGGGLPLRLTPRHGIWRVQAIVLERLREAAAPSGAPTLEEIWEASTEEERLLIPDPLRWVWGSNPEHRGVGARSGARAYTRPCLPPPPQAHQASPWGRRVRALRGPSVVRFEWRERFASGRRLLERWPANVGQRAKAHRVSHTASTRAMVGKRGVDLRMDSDLRVKHLPASAQTHHSHLSHVRARQSSQSAPLRSRNASWTARPAPWRAPTPTRAGVAEVPRPPRGVGASGGVAPRPHLPPSNLPPERPPHVGWGGRGASQNNAGRALALARGDLPYPAPEHRWPQRAGGRPPHLASLGRRGWGPWAGRLNGGLLGEAPHSPSPGVDLFYDDRGAWGADGVRPSPLPPRAPRLRRTPRGREYVAPHLFEGEYLGLRPAPLGRPRSKGLVGPFGRGPAPSLRPKVDLHLQGRLGGGGAVGSPGADTPPHWGHGPQPWPLIWSWGRQKASAQWAWWGRLRLKWAGLPSRREAFSEALLEDRPGAPLRDLACLVRDIWRAGVALKGALPHICRPLPPLRPTLNAFIARLGPLPELYSPALPPLPPTPTLPAASLPDLASAEPLGAFHKLVLPLTMGVEIGPLAAIGGALAFYHTARAAWAWGEAWGETVWEAAEEVLMVSGHAGRTAGTAAGGLGQVVVADVEGRLALLRYLRRTPLRPGPWAHARAHAVAIIPFGFPPTPAPYAPHCPQWPLTAAAGTWAHLLALALWGPRGDQEVLVHTLLLGPRRGGALARAQEVAQGAVSGLVWPYYRRPPVWWFPLGSPFGVSPGFPLNIPFGVSPGSAEAGFAEVWWLPLGAPFGISLGAAELIMALLDANSGYPRPARARPWAERGLGERAGPGGLGRPPGGGARPPMALAYEAGRESGRLRWGLYQSGRIGWHSGGVRARSEAWQYTPQPPWGRRIKLYSIWEMWRHDYDWQYTFWEKIFLWPILIEYALWFMYPRNPIRRYHFYYDKPSMPLAVTSAPQITDDDPLTWFWVSGPAGLSPRSQGHTTALFDRQRARARNPNFRQAGSRALALWGGADALPCVPTWEARREMGSELLADEPGHGARGRFVQTSVEPYIHRLTARHSVWWGAIAARADISRLGDESALDSTLEEWSEPYIQAYNDVMDPILKAIDDWLYPKPTDQAWRLWPHVFQLVAGEGERLPFSGPHMQHWVAPESRRYHHNPRHLRGVYARCVGGRLPPYTPSAARALEYRPEKWGGGAWAYSTWPNRAGPFLGRRPPGSGRFRRIRLRHRMYGPKGRGWPMTRPPRLPVFRRSWTTRIAHMMLGGTDLDDRLVALGIKLLRRTWWLAPLRWYILGGAIEVPASEARDRPWKGLAFGPYRSRWGLHDFGRPPAFSKAWAPTGGARAHSPRYHNPRRPSGPWGRPLDWAHPRTPQRGLPTYPRRAPRAPTRVPAWPPLRPWDAPDPWVTPLARGGGPALRPPIRLVWTKPTEPGEVPQLRVQRVPPGIPDCFNRAKAIFFHVRLRPLGRRSRGHVRGEGVLPPEAYSWLWRRYQAYACYRFHAVAGTRPGRGGLRRVPKEVLVWGCWESTLVRHRRI